MKTCTVPAALDIVDAAAAAAAVLYSFYLPRKGGKEGSVVRSSMRACQGGTCAHLDPSS